VRDFGVAIQFSVFKAELDQKRLEQLMTLLKPLINPRVDSINFYPMNAKDTMYLGVHPLSDTVGVF
jgi:CRISPR/Cas system-associated endoribonuclease Cas2